MNWKCMAVAFGGSIAAEIAIAYKTKLGTGRFPERYNDISFWVVRLFVALIGPFLVYVLEIDKPQFAMYVGVSAPFIMMRMVQTPASIPGLPPSGDPRHPDLPPSDDPPPTPPIQPIPPNQSRQPQPIPQPKGKKGKKTKSKR